LKNVIVGYDAGLNTGVAILDIEGNIIFVKTFRGEENEKIISEVMKFGKPIVIATDKRKVSKKVKEIASSFGCKVFRPKRDLLREEKEEIVRETNFKVEDDHQRDALASALYAYRRIKKRIDKIKEYLKSKNLEEFFDEVLYHSFRNYGINIARVLEILSTKEKEKRVEEKERERKEEILKFEENLRLKKRIKELEEELSYYKKLKMIFSELLEYKEKYTKLEKFFSLLKKMYELEKNGILPIIDLDVFDFNDVDKFIGLKNLLIFSNDVKKFKILNGFEIRALFTEVEEQIDLKFPVFRIKRSSLLNFDNLLGIYKKDFEKMMRDVLKEELKKWVEEEKLR